MPTVSSRHKSICSIGRIGQVARRPNSTLGLALSASDRFDLGGIQHVVNGQPIQLAVVDQDKMIVMIDRQDWNCGSGWS